MPFSDGDFAIQESASPTPSTIAENNSPMPSSTATSSPSPSPKETFASSSPTSDPKTSGDNLNNQIQMSEPNKNSYSDFEVVDQKNGLAKDSKHKNILIIVIILSTLGTIIGFIATIKSLRR